MVGHPRSPCGSARRREGRVRVHKHGDFAGPRFGHFLLHSRNTKTNKTLAFRSSLVSPSSLLISSSRKPNSDLLSTSKTCARSVELSFNRWFHFHAVGKCAHLVPVLFACDSYSAKAHILRIMVPFSLITIWVGDYFCRFESLLARHLTLCYEIARLIREILRWFISIRTLI